MTARERKFRIDDLYIGMEFSDIYDTWILLVKNENSGTYTIQFIGKETNAESDRLFSQGNIVCPVYNDSPCSL